MWRDLARALSLANLCLLYPAVTLFLTPSNQYYMAAPPGAPDLVAWLLNLLLLAGLFWLAARLLRQHENGVTLRLALLALTGLLVFGVVQLLRSVPSIPLALLDPTVRRIGKLAVLALLAAAAFGFLLGAARCPRLLLRWGSHALLALSPFFPLIAAQTAWATLRTSPTTAPAAATPSVNGRALPGRVVVLLFDELDYGIAFAKRPPDLRLPELDRFQAASLAASQAFPPAGNTLESIPSLLCGQRIAAVDKRGGSELRVRFAGAADSASWKDTDTLFTRVRALGGRSAVAGWYHPYPRIVGRDVERCSWQTYYFWTDREGNSLLDTMWRQLALSELVGKAPAARLNRQHHIRSFEGIEREALAIAADPTYGLAFAHLPAPHMPGIFDRRLQRITPIQGMGMEAYLGNLALVDRTLGKVRREMTATGAWDASTIIVTSDHWLRLAGLDPKESFRVPFLVKLPGQRAGQAYLHRLNTVLTHDLILKQVKDPIYGPGELMDWLDARRAHADQQ
ncbi:MAG: sulfatase-like hydrolase/transferase [Actinomycetota bacterium]